jgi:hypothetical protein
MYAYDQQQEDITRINEEYSVANSIPSNLLKNKQPRGNQSRVYTINKTVKSLNDEYRKTVTIKVHGSGDYGSYIKNAVTGAYTNHRVGSEAEYLYYTVADCTGMDKLNGPVHLYYNSPSEYEKHQFTSVDQEKKDEWLKRVNLLKDKYM